MNKQTILDHMRALVERHCLRYKTDYYTHDLAGFTCLPNVAKWYWSVGEDGTHLWQQTHTGMTKAIKTLSYRHYKHHAIDFAAGTFVEISVDELE